MEILSLGEKIKRRRKELQMTLKDLAGDRITPGQISLVESGKSNPSMDLLEYLAGKLDISVEYIMESEETQAEKICLFYESIAETYILSEDLTQGEENIEKGIYYAEKYKLDYRKARLFFLRASICLSKGEKVLAQQFFLSANVIFIKNNYYEEIIDTFINLGKITLDLKAYYSANGYFHQAEKVFIDNNIGNDFIIANIYYYMATTYLKLEDMENAINYTYLSKEKFSQINDREKYAKSMMLLALEYSKNQDIENAIKYSKKSLEIFKEIDNLNYVAQIENNIGRLFADFENLEESFAHLNKSKELRIKNKDKKLIETLINICNNYIKVKDVEKSKDTLCLVYDQISSGVLGELENKYLVEYYLIKHKVDKIDGEIDEAENSLLLALKVAEENNMDKSYAEISIVLGKFYVDTCQEGKASLYLNKGVEIFKKLGVIKDF
ncbi:helix-turn-helix domain-containing protein [Haloimpatiens sp. FM7315]|uniref:helix-turn-helix domain-containing protein n=1 Tax=Haloimpatiens sp. FM7315 TaxID=3298609 RepID=UPI0035A327E7